MNTTHQQNTAAPFLRAADSAGRGCLLLPAPARAHRIRDLVGDAIGALCVTVVIPGAGLFLSLIFGG